MRRRLVRNGMRFVLASLFLIMLVSFFHGVLAAIFSLSITAEQGLYGNGIFLAAALGGYGVVVTVSGLALSPDGRDTGIKILPALLMLICLVVMFFYLLVSSFNSSQDQQQQLPGTSISI